VAPRDELSAGALHQLKLRFRNKPVYDLSIEKKKTSELDASYLLHRCNNAAVLGCGNHFGATV